MPTQPAQNKKQDKKTELITTLIQAQNKARIDPIWFASEMLRLKRFPSEPSLKKNSDLSWELDAWQVELLEATADIYRKLVGTETVINHDGKNYITIRAPHGPGKTFGAAMLMHWFGFCFDGLIACTAPKMDQLKTRLWREFKKIQSRSVKDYASLMRVDTTKITWGGSFINQNGQRQTKEWVALAETASSPENLAGFHDRHIMFIVDEASGVPESLYPVVFSALSTGWLRILVLIGNPTKRIGTFAASHLQPEVSKDFYKLHITLDKTTRVKRAWVDQMIRQYGENSPIVKVRCYGEFAEASDYQLIALEWIEAARNHEFNVEKGDGSIPRLIVSVDVADGGMDETVITVAHHYQTKTVINKILRYNFEQSKSPILAAEKAMQIYSAWGGKDSNGDCIVVDSLGVGAGTAGRLMQFAEQHPMNIVAYKGGAASDDNSRWRNKRVQSYLILRDAFRDKQIVFAESCLESREDWTELEAQLCCIKIKPGSERVEDLLSKEELKRQGIKSPDIADSIAMQFATTQNANNAFGFSFDDIYEAPNSIRQDW